MTCWVFQAKDRNSQGERLFQRHFFWGEFDGIFQWFQRHQFEDSKLDPLINFEHGKDGKNCQKWSQLFGDATRESRFTVLQKYRGGISIPPTGQFTVNYVSMQRLIESTFSIHNVQRTFSPSLFWSWLTRCNGRYPFLFGQSDWDANTAMSYLWFPSFWADFWRLQRFVSDHSESFSSSLNAQIC